MLRMYFLQQGFTLSDEGLEDAIYDSQALRNFMSIDLGVEAVPDATTLLKFRRLLERHGLIKTLFDGANAELSARGLLLLESTMVDASIIVAAPSTKNREERRDAQMHQTKEGNQWYFGMKAHIWWMRTPPWCTPWSERLRPKWTSIRLSTCSTAGSKRCMPMRAIPS